MKAKRLVETKVHYKFFYSVQIEGTHEPLKVAAAKNFLSGVYVIDATCFDECFLFHVTIERWFLFLKVCCGFEIFLTAILLLFFEESILNKVCILRYLHNNRELLIPKSQSKAIYYTYT